MLSIDELCEIEKGQESRIIEKFLANDPIHLFRSLSNKHNLYAINCIAKSKIQAAKQHFYNVAFIDSYRIRQFHSKFLDYDITRVLSAILSDNWEFLEKEYSKLTYSSFYLDDKTEEKLPLVMGNRVLEGESAIWCNTIQHLMAEDLEKVQRNLNILETLTLPKLPKNQKELLIDYEFYKALIANDRDKCEELLEQLVSPKVHKKRNDNAMLAKYVSQPALGYTKLAWRYGLEVDIDNPLIPQEMLPIEPLDHYEIPYDFLKDQIT